jgi:protein tyrosine phosphatase
MKIDTAKVYNDINNSDTALIVRNIKDLKNSELTRLDANNSNSTKTTNSESLLSKNERDFFINMFPDNTEQIERHILFNRNGKLQSADIQKGSIFDGYA